MSGHDPRNGTVLALACARLKRGDDPGQVLEDCLPMLDGSDWLRSVLRSLCGWPPRYEDAALVAADLRAAWGIGS